MAACRTRWSTDKCELGTGRQGATPEIIGNITTTARKISSVIASIGLHHRQPDAEIDGSQNPPKQKSP